MTSALLEAFALLRLEELRDDVRRDLVEAARWKVTASGRGMFVNAGPHQLHLSASHPTLSRVDLVYVGLADGRVWLRSLVGCVAPSPFPPPLPVGGGLPLAWVTVTPFANTISQWNISPIGDRT